ncbi:MAG: hypothetical protein ACLFM2_05480 [Halothece sp.]
MNNGILDRALKVIIRSIISVKGEFITAFLVNGLFNQLRDREATILAVRLS